MPAAIKQKLQASRRSQVVNGTDLERTFYIVLLNSIKERKKRENERKKGTGKAEKVPSVLWDQWNFLARRLVRKSAN